MNQADLLHLSFKPDSPDELGKRRVLDVRRAAAFDQATTMIPGATWRDPEDVAEWSRELPIDRDLVVYCVHGHEVSQTTAARLHAAGFKARYLVGGIEGWQAAGFPLAAKETP